MADPVVTLVLLVALLPIDLVGVAAAGVVGAVGGRRAAQSLTDRRPAAPP
jgi:hypothetical protein